jgi:hypothetical protein
LAAVLTGFAEPERRVRETGCGDNRASNLDRSSTNEGGKCWQQIVSLYI